MTRAVHRALDLLETVRDASEPVSLTELANAAGIDKATAKRIAADLVRRHYLEYLTGVKRYTLGFSALKLGSRSLGPDSSAQKTMRYLEDLRDKTLQTVALCARSGQHYVVTLELLSLEPIKYSRGVGATFALGEDAPGAAILAFDNIGNGGSFRFSPDEADAGYAYSCSNTLPRVASVAAPILRSGQMPSAVCLSWVLDRSDNDDMVRRRYGAQVVACAQRLAHI